MVIVHLFDCLHPFDKDASIGIDTFRGQGGCAQAPVEPGQETFGCL